MLNYQRVYLELLDLPQIYIYVIFFFMDYDEAFFMFFRVKLDKVEVDVWPQLYGFYPNFRFTF